MHERFPSTRYAGSKRKLLPLLAGIFEQLDFDTALDPFCGTGAVSYLLKSVGKKVTASDCLSFNAICARALVENDHEKLGKTAAELVEDLPLDDGPVGFVEQTFDEIFFEKSENRFVDQLADRIRGLSGYRRDLAMWALFQSCLAKRPYNLFHRANLSMRRRDVSRSFGNKATWDTPFEVHFERFASAADLAVFDSGKKCRVLCRKAEEVEDVNADLVYLDPPYVSASGTGVDYLDHYHFLEGLSLPSEWSGQILHKYKHKPLMGKGENPWSDSERIPSAFEEIIEKYLRSLLVISYRSDGIPSLADIERMMRKAGKTVARVDFGSYVYALSRNKGSTEAVLIGR